VLVLAGGADPDCRNRPSTSVSLYSVRFLADGHGWVLEQGVWSWLAVLPRLSMGSVRYGDNIIPAAAHLRRYLCRLAAERTSKRESPAREAAVGLPEK
jgi:hypothetical protein